ncbi:hypothetical protein P691DRAFT_323479 [Macrolepiota fuliginosa MF-IS2]|uniref:CCHC-type domain-containing protein n=1 Tax=Macrolepiota fuliginosa MF-IS2 TaxID=1400762 RepID=A0A9P6BYX1_9AGAR|nr:hypothetical protein P691DRAFT_323479 [Macrolepiota fuliginosa MF-IS2]
MAQPQNQPLVRLTKADLIVLAQNLRLNPQGTVKDLRLRIRTHLLQDPNLQKNPTYQHLLPQSIIRRQVTVKHRATRAQNHREDSQPQDSPPSDGGFPEWNGIPQLSPPPNPFKPVVVRPTPRRTNSPTHNRYISTRQERTPSLTLSAAQPPVSLFVRELHQPTPLRDDSPRPHPARDNFDFGNSDLNDPFLDDFEPTKLAPAQPSKGRPAIVPGLEGQPWPFVVPDTIREKMEQGWHEHVALTYLTDRFCVPGSDLEIRGQQYTVDDVTGTHISVDKPLVDTDENRISFDEWHQAWLRLLDLISTYTPSIHSAWKAHYERILMAPDRASNWYTWRDYDIEIRKQSLYIPIDPRCFHQRIWSHLDSENTIKHALQLIQHPAPRPSPNYQRQYPNRPFPGSPCPAPTPNNTFGGPSQANWRPPIRCFFCGDSSHGSRNCLATIQINGRPLILLRSGAKGRRCDEQGLSYCFSFNGISGCRIPDCNRKHWCSLCRDLNHGAQICPSI